MEQGGIQTPLALVAIGDEYYVMLYIHTQPVTVHVRGRLHGQSRSIIPCVTPSNETDSKTDVMRQRFVCNNKRLKHTHRLQETQYTLPHHTTHSETTYSRRLKH